MQHTGFVLIGNYPASNPCTVASDTKVKGTLPMVKMRRFTGNIRTMMGVVTCYVTFRPL